MVNAKATTAHRFSYELNVGSIEDGKYVCHTCDNPRCVKPSHLFLGTPLDNKRDSVNKKRHARGETNGNALLSREQASEIRYLYALGRIRRGRGHYGTFRQVDLARMYGVQRATIANIVDRRNWIH